MSVLLIGLDPPVCAALIDRLIDQDDEVGVVEDDPQLTALWRETRAHVAQGDPADLDLIQRAATHARTIIVGERVQAGPQRVAETAMQAALRGGLDARVVVLASASGRAPRLHPEGVEVLVLTYRKMGLDRLLSRTPSPSKLAEALDAADDIAELPGDHLDLGERSSWEALGLIPP
ncbi:MAG: hypothetical protein M3345_03805 [Actinomycetota bacterium]|nr:hypothetical protein [Actinomycetota bacterium]